MRNILMAGVGLASLVGAVPALAQTPPGAPSSANDAPTTSVETVVVTARKREERLFDVPAAVSAITPQQIASLHLQDARDLLTLIPTAFLQENNAGTARDISIRGVGTPNIFAEPGVALYLDGIFSSDFISYPTQFYDLERVEVLRGPQGALYGRDAVGGAVNVISKLPTARYEGSLQGTYGQYDHAEVQGVANLPLTDTFAIRVFAWGTRQTQGEYHNTTLNRYIDRNNTAGARVTAQYKPTDKLTLRVIGEYFNAYGPGTNIYFPTGGETKKNLQRDTDARNHFMTERLSAEADYATDYGDLTLIAGGRDYRLEGLEDTDISADLLPSAEAPAGKETTARTNSVRSRYVEGRFLTHDFGPFNLLAGFNYLHSNATGDIFTDLAGFSLALTGGAAPLNIAIDNLQSVESWAGFLEATYKIRPDLSLIADVRYTSDTKNLNFQFAPSPLVQALLGPTIAVSPSKGFTNLSPGATLAWNPREDVRFYGKVQTGFRAGGYNFNVARAADLPYNQETSVDYEVGAKKRFMDGRAFISADVFYLDQHHVLVPLIDTGVAGPLSGYLKNLGNARTVGEEAEASVQVLRGLSFTGSLGHLDAELTSGSDPSGSLKGKQLPSSREWTTAVTGSYRRPLFDGATLMADAAYTYRSAGFQDVDNLYKFGGNELVNASLGITFRNFEVSAYVQNALDNDYDIAFGGYRSTTNSLGQVRAQGRTYGVTGKVSF